MKKIHFKILQLALFGILCLCIVGCNAQKRVAKSYKECTDDTYNIYGETLFTLDTTHIKNTRGTPNVFFENDSIRKSIQLHRYSQITVYEENKNHNRSKWLTYKDLKLATEHEVFRFKFEERHINVFINEAKYYDNTGQLIKTTDYRQKEKYPVCYRKAYALAQKWKPKRYLIDNMGRDSIVNTKGTTYTWWVHVTPKNYKGKSYYYTINAKNGRKLNKTKTTVVPSGLSDL